MRIINRRINHPINEWQWLYGIGDVHLGSINADERQVIEDMEDAREHGARILMPGDIFDLILPKDHRRYMASVLIPQIRDRDDQINSLVQHGIQLMKPYADLIDMIGMGNHEYSILKYHSVDVTRLLLDGLNEHLRQSGSEHRIAHGGYCGYVQYTDVVAGYDASVRNQKVCMFDVLYHHGGGSESPVTKGMIDISRKRVNWVYDLFIFGHKHNLFAAADVTISVTGRGNLCKRDTRSIQTGSYLKNYHVQTEDQAAVMAYSEVSNMAPKPIGCGRAKWRWVTSDGKSVLQVRAEV